MPTYEYRCQQGHTFEVVQRMSDGPVLTCETCSAPVERVFHPVAVHFKGSGFYNTDYGTRRRQRELKESAEGKKSSEGKKSDSESSSSSTKSDSSGGSTKSDSSSSSTKSETKASADA
jgi:putative FmdB family regulatory protein